MSVLEAAFSRGDEHLSPLIEEAWRLGCRLDAWTEFFDPQKWREAMEHTGISAAEYAERDYAPDSPLPWDNIDTGITKSFLWKECQKAASAEFTADCRKVCHACGLKCRPEEMRKEQPVVTVSPSDRKSGKSLPMEGVSIRARLQYAKKGSLRYLSHLETTTALIRGMRRAGFPFKYTEGFHPGPKVSFGPALPVGTAGLREYMDVELIPPFDVQNGLRLLKDHLPDDLQASVIQAIPKNTKSLAAYIVRYLSQSPLSF